VLITGGARGQGRAHAVASARQGADVVLLDVASPIETSYCPLASEEDLDDTVRLVKAEGREAIGLVGDVRSQHDVDAAVAEAIGRFGKLDALIANAAIVGPMENFWQISECSWLDVMDINLSGVWRAAKAVAPHMIERQSGSIVMTSSVNGIEAGQTITSYVVAKHAVIGLAKNVALELGPSGVRCNVICPGVIDTPMVDNQAARAAHTGSPDGTREDLLNAVYHFHLLKGTTVMPPEVIADAGVFLNSPLARTVTGAVLPVDAGHLVLPGFNHAPIRPVAV
jgi:SDR family mycofactocin-dependent oxidoreductase